MLVNVAEEATTTATFAIRYPLGILETALTTGQPSDGPAHDTPVLLVHGYGHNQSGWWSMDRYMRNHGHTSIHRLNYLPLGRGVPVLAARLAKRVSEIRDLTGAEKIHIVGHSLGGILLRWYIQELGGDEIVDNAITLASPHEGTAMAYLWPERTAQHIRPGSWVINRLRDGARPSTVRWTAFWSDSDLLVQPHTAAQLLDPVLGATNVRVRGVGHLTFLSSPRVIRAVTAQVACGYGHAEFAQ
jgi:triacylglycerol lipase